MHINILAIESSCDETSAAIIADGQVLSNVIASQKIHEAYGGVVPELASRAHLANIIPVVEEALTLSSIPKNKLSAIAFTEGPGLIGSLLVGSSFAKAMALALGIPLIAVHHMQAHVLAHFIKEPKPRFPFICLTVSGGHTQLVLVKDYLTMEIIGQTIDDAAGEAFDKTAKLLNLPYPGGPLIDKYAQQGDASAFQFPEPDVALLDFSFSGLKTSILYFLRNQVKQNPSFIENRLNDICASVQQRIISILMNKLEQAVLQYKVNDVAIAGGVSANSGLRNALKHAGDAKGWNIFLPEMQYCTDNAAMIAITAHYKFMAGEFVSLDAAPSPSFAWK